MKKWTLVAGLGLVGWAAACEDESLPGLGTTLNLDAGAVTIDASAVALDAAADAEGADAGACDPASLFGTPQPLGIDTASTADDTPALSADELTLVFASTGRAGGAGGQDIFVATRASALAPFSVPTAIAAIGTTANERSPGLTADSLGLYFSSGGEVLLSSRPSVGAAFGTAIDVTALGSLNEEDGPSFAPGTPAHVWFSSNRSGTSRIWVSEVTGGTHAAPTPVTELDGDGADGEPSLTADGLTLYFQSSRSGGKGGTDVWSASRATTAVAFGAPTLVANVNAAEDDTAPFVSPDGCRLYLASKRVGGVSRLYVASKLAR